MPTIFRGDNMTTSLHRTTVQNSYGEVMRLIVTAEQTDNDFNGNPMVLVQVWTDETANYRGNVWYPKIKGQRVRKDRKYKVYMYGDINNTVDIFIRTLQNSLLGLI
jgi:hypothetical protein